jgi:hypothetical protein
MQTLGLTYTLLRNLNGEKNGEIKLYGSLRHEEVCTYRRSIQM